jgi:hypothetical protein
MKIGQQGIAIGAKLQICFLDQIFYYIGGGSSPFTASAAYDAGDQRVKTLDEFHPCIISRILAALLQKLIDWQSLVIGFAMVLPASTIRMYLRGNGPIVGQR